MESQGQDANRVECDVDHTSLLDSNLHQQSSTAIPRLPVSRLIMLNRGCAHEEGNGAFLWSLGD